MEDIRYIFVKYFEIIKKAKIYIKNDKYWRIIIIFLKNNDDDNDNYIHWEIW